MGGQRLPVGPRWSCHFGLGLAVLALASACTGTLTTEIALEEGAHWTLEFPPNELRELRFAVPGGHYVDLSIDQEGVDVVSTLLGPGGEELSVVDTATGSASVEQIRFVAPRTGGYALRLDPGSGTPTGRVVVGVRALRAASPKDRQRAAASAAIAKAHLAWIAGDHRGTEAAVRGALVFLDTLAEREAEVEARHLLGLALEGQGSLAEAADQLEGVTRGYAELRRFEDEALALNQLGRLLRTLGRPVSAEASYRRALALARRVGDRTVEAAAVQNLALVAQQLGEVEEALTLGEQALTLRRQIGPPGETALALRRLGSLYTLIGRDADGLVLLEEAWQVARQHGGFADQARALDALGWARHHAGRSEDALVDYEQALELSEDLDGDLRLDLLARRASVLRAVGRQEEAWRDYQEVLRHRVRTGEVTGQGYAHANLGLVALELGESVRARDHLEKAIRLLDGRDRGEGWYWAHLGLGKLERREGRERAAQAHLETAVASLEAMRGPLLSWLSRGYFLGTRFEAYEELVGLWMDLHERFPEQGYDRTALEVAERARMRSLLEHLSVGDTSAPPMSNRLAEIRRLEMERLRLQRREPGSPRLAAMDERLRRLWLQAERSPALAAPEAMHLDFLDAAGMQELLDPSTRFLVFSLGEPESYLWVVARDGIESFRITGRGELTELADRYLEALRASEDSVGAGRAARRGLGLSDALLGPAGDALQGGRLAVVPDGILHLVPFAALPVPGSAGLDELLVDRFELVTVPSPSVLALQRQRTQGRNGRQGAAVVADPVYQPDDERVVAGASASSSASSRSSIRQIPSDLERSMADLDLPRFPRLVATGEEAAAILDRLPEGATFEASGFDASPERVLRADLENFPILHFAVHGLIHPVHPELSGIVLSMVDRNGLPRDGFLRAHQIGRLKLPAELVVLSACRTAAGHEVRGEAPLGLAQAFFRAGSRRVLASYWNVNDRGTAVLMDRFYGALLDEGQSPGAALRTAQLALRRSEEWSSPYHWAAFQLQGEWRGRLAQHARR
jgi:CHAT domain-containing protein/tetratricopeptide (TPR) repeat protein